MNEVYICEISYEWGSWTIYGVFSTREKAMDAAVPLLRQYLEEKCELEDDEIQEWINGFIECGDDDYIMVYPRTLDKAGNL